MMFIDYAPCESCNNPDTFGMICVKCGECPLRADTPDQQCEWIRAREARELLGEEQE